MVTSHDFQLSALPMMGRAELSDSSDFRRVFGACFSMSPNLCVHVWDEIEDALPSGVMICHLLWALLFLKAYSTEDTMVVMVQTTWKNKDGCRGDPLINICKFVASFVFFIVKLF